MVDFPYRLNLRLNNDERAQIEMLADERGVSMSEMARMLMFQSAPTHRHRRRDAPNRRRGRTARAVASPRRLPKKPAKPQPVQTPTRVRIRARVAD